MSTMGYDERASASAMVLNKNDYVTAVVLNQSDQALIVETCQPQTGSISWEIIGCLLHSDENPITAVQTKLKQYLGHEDGYWVYLGSYEEGRGNVGHFFVVQNVPVTDSSRVTLPPTRQAKWVSVCDLRMALLDGRFTNMSYAANVSLALYLFPPPCRNRRGAAE